LKMGDLAGGAAAGGQLVGGVLGIAGTLLKSKAQANAIKANIRALKVAAIFREEEDREEERRIRGSNITTIAKSGVRRSGSPAEVLIDNAEAAEKQRYLNNKILAATITQMRSEKKSLGIQSSISVASQVFGTAARATSAYGDS